MRTSPFYLQIIQSELSRRQSANPSYSLRAYGRDLGVHPATLSQILKGNRPLPFKVSKSVIQKLQLGPKERTLFQESLNRKHALLDQIQVKNEERFLLDESHHRIIAEWEHYAVLTLFDLSDFRATDTGIAKRLGLTALRTKVVLQNLKVAGLLEVRGKLWARTHARVRTTEDVSSVALQKSHEENLGLAAKKLESTRVEERDYSSSTFALDTEKMPELKAIIREFREKVATLSQQSKTKNEIYQMAIQLYPLTQKITGESK